MAAAARRRLWELAPRHHCALLGAAFDLRELRQLFRRAGSTGCAEASDYELHSSAVHFAREKNDFSLPAHKLLEERYRDMVLRLRDAETGRDVVAKWRQFAAQGESVGAYWAALTHPACDEAAGEILAEEMHMATHHAFSERRAAARRVRDLRERNAGLEHTLEGARARISALKRETAATRAETLAAQAGLHTARLQHEAARAELGSWKAGAATCALLERIAALEAELVASRETAKCGERALREAQRRIAILERDPLPVSAPPEAAGSAIEVEGDLARRRVLCLGGKVNLVPQYRTVVERARGEFVHHDGGLEHHLSRLPALLASADAVVCLAADCGHGAYRLAKRYCKSKGKPCALLGSSSVHALTRCIEGFRAAA